MSNRRSLTRPQRERWLTVPGKPIRDRHLTAAWDYLSLVVAGRYADGDRLIDGLRNDPAVDPWLLVPAIAVLAAQRPCGRQHAKED